MSRKKHSPIMEIDDDDGDDVLSDDALPYDHDAALPPAAAPTYASTAVDAADLTKPLANEGQLGLDLAKEAQAYLAQALSQLSSMSSAEVRYKLVWELLMKLVGEQILNERFLKMLWQVQKAAPGEYLRASRWLLESGRFATAPVEDSTGGLLDRYAIILRAGLMQEVGHSLGQTMLLDVAVESVRQWVLWSHRSSWASDGFGPEIRQEIVCRQQANKNRQVFLKIMADLGISKPSEKSHRKMRPITKAC